MAVGTKPRHFLSFVTLQQTILIGSILSCNAMNIEYAAAKWMCTGWNSKQVPVNTIIKASKTDKQ